MYEKYLRGTAQILQSSQQETKSYKINVAGLDFVVNRNVFSPKYFKDTEIFATRLPVEPGDELCEIGPGCGAVSIHAAKRGAKRIVAIDINPDAVKTSEENTILHRLDHIVEVRTGNMFDALNPDEFFDTIFWNTPFGLVPEYAKVSILERAVFDPGYKATHRFITEGPQHLKPNGRLLIGFSSTLGRLDLIEQFCGEAGLCLNLLHREQSTEVYPVCFELLEARK